MEVIVKLFVALCVNEIKVGRKKKKGKRKVSESEPWMGQHGTCVLAALRKVHEHAQKEVGSTLSVALREVVFVLLHTNQSVKWLMMK